VDDPDTDAAVDTNNAAAATGAPADACSLSSTLASLSPFRSLKRLRKSRSRRPKVGASTVTASAVAPIASARRTNRRTC